MEHNPRIVHVIERLAPGGAATALVETARRLTAAGQRHEVLSLEPPVAASADYASRAGLRVIDAGTLEAEPEKTIDRLVEDADLVWVHAWTSPALDAFLRRPLAPARWLIWLHVAGDSAPHVLTTALAGFADVLVASSPYTASVPAFVDARAETDVVLSGGDLAPHAAAFARRSRSAAFRIGYVGALDAAKIHPDFVAISAAAAIPTARFDVFGAGVDDERLRREIARSGDDRFQLHGWARDVPAVLAGMDVFGYPLARDGYATAELVVQEAMASGLPPVLLDHGAAVHLIEPGKTGLIARDEEDYPRRLEALAANPDLRRDLGAAARRHALARFGADHAARAFEPILARMLDRPKQARAWADQETSGAGRFTAALGEAAVPFITSRTPADDPAARAADERIAHATPALSSATSGGILHWRRAYPTDPWLRLWSGLHHREQGRTVAALGEFLRAGALGLASPRLERYIAECSALAHRQPEARV